MLRFAAALAVLQCHLSIRGHNVGTVGAAGVDVFFVLSGFIVSLTARDHPQGFLRNRLIRVLPTYYFAALLAVIAASHDGLEWRRLLATVTLWPAYETFVTPYLTVAWSLCYEMVFYAGLGLVLLGVRPWVLLAGFAAMWVGAVATGWAVFDFLGSPIILEFLAGAVIARLPRGTTVLGVAAVGLALAGFALSSLIDPTWLSMQPVADPWAWLRVAVWGIPAALLVYGALQLEPWFRLPWAVPFAFLGDASYALYLFHLIVLELLLPAGWPLWVVGAACIAVSAGLYLFLEKPLLKLLRGMWAQPRAPATA